ncbi:hypothetical protein [Pseudomonas oryziphila]|uniref:Uncharacterized protein n=1 Tax=Pseudomonas oryziphila TaxID=2894079 RepID=A0ABN5TEF7_9PSED|nr:hypothetical protein [Pseudomonas oryziphila]AZL73389.1 hypothetical protein EI693_09930 [Pseudomonas oryziphila]
MANIDKLKTALADKFGKKEEDIKDNTPIKDIVSNNSALDDLLKTEFNAELSRDVVENLSDVQDLSKHLP